MKAFEGKDEGTVENAFGDAIFSERALREIRVRTAGTRGGLARKKKR
jgi:hypothetical protein